jgi:hypothetical protein
MPAPAHEVAAVPAVAAIAVTRPAIATRRIAIPAPRPAVEIASAAIAPYHWTTVAVAAKSASRAIAATPPAAVASHHSTAAITLHRIATAPATASAGGGPTASASASVIALGDHDGLLGRSSRRVVRQGSEHHDARRQAQVRVVMHVSLLIILRALEHRS